MENGNLNDDERRQIAGLKFDPGFMLLCDLLQAHVDNLADAMHGADRTEDFLRYGRLWQATRTILNTLKVEPENLAQAIEQEKGREALDVYTRPNQALKHMLENFQTNQKQFQAIYDNLEL